MLLDHATCFWAEIQFNLLLTCMFFSCSTLLGDDLVCFRAHVYVFATMHFVFDWLSYILPSVFFFSTED